MKIGLFILLLCAYHQVFSQKYHPIPNDSAAWIVEYVGIDGNGDYEDSYHKYKNYVNGDTIINDTSFTRLYRESKYGIEFEGFLYQDTLKQRVYYTDVGRNYKTLLYDFNLKEGEVFEILFLGDYYVRKVDSIEIEGTFRKRISFDVFNYYNSDLDYLEFIEGIGSNAGLFIYDYLGLVVSFLSCYQEKSTPIYPLDIQKYGCDLNAFTTVSNKTTLQPRITVTPNPFNNKIVLQTEVSDISQLNIKIYNSSGHIVYHNYCNINNSKEIDLHRLEAGLYLIIIDDKSTNRVKKIILKE